VWGRAQHGKGRTWGSFLANQWVVSSGTGRTDRVFEKEDFGRVFVVDRVVIELWGK